MYAGHVPHAAAISFWVTPAASRAWRACPVRSALRVAEISARSARFMIQA